MGTRFRRWWRHENYNREDMRRFREENPDWNSLPNAVLAQTFASQALELRRRFEELGGVLGGVLSEIDSFIRSYRDLEEEE